MRYFMPITEILRAKKYTVPCLALGKEEGKEYCMALEFLAELSRHVKTAYIDANKEFSKYPFQRHKNM